MIPQSMDGPVGTLPDRNETARRQLVELMQRFPLSAENPKDRLDGYERADIGITDTSPSGIAQNRNMTNTIRLGRLGLSEMRTFSAGTIPVVRGVLWGILRGMFWAVRCQRATTTPRLRTEGW
jgi:hypothetical protein